MASGRSREPWHTGHSVLARKREYITRYCTLWRWDSIHVKNPSMPVHAPSPCHRYAFSSSVNWKYGRWMGNLRDADRRMNSRFHSLIVGPRQGATASS